MPRPLSANFLCELQSYGSHKNYRQSPTCSTDLSSSQIVRQLSIAPDSCTDDSWQQSAGDGSEVKPWSNLLAMVKIIIWA